MKPKIRILHITQAAGGGVERYIQLLLKNLDHGFCENYLLVSNETDRSVYEGLAAYVEQIDMRREIGLYDFLAAAKVRRVIQRMQPDIIYAHSSKAGALTRLANLGLDRVCVYNAHGWAFNIQGSVQTQRLYTLLEKLLAPLCDKIICISETEKRAAIQRKISGQDKFRVILNGIDVDCSEKKPATSSDRTLLGIPEDAYVVGMVGRVCRQKAPDTFIQAAELIRQHIPNAFFVIVGNGEMEKEVLRFASEHGFSASLLITGWVENPQEYMRVFDVAVLLSRWEGFGLVLPEYMLAQKPIVATRVCAIPELIQDRVNGLLVPAEAPAAVCDAVYELYQNTELRERIVRQGALDACEKYDIKRVAQEHMCLFRQLLQNRSG